MLEEEPLLNPEGYVKGLQIPESHDCFLLQLHTLIDVSNSLTSSTTHWKQWLLKAWLLSCLKVLSTLESQILLEDLYIPVVQAPINFHTLMKIQ